MSDAPPHKGLDLLFRFASLVAFTGWAVVFAFPLVPEPARTWAIGIALAVLCAEYVYLLFLGGRFDAAGERPRIRDFLRGAASESLRLMADEGDAVTVGVRDTAGAADHPASASQSEDIAAVLKAARQLAQR